MENISVSVRVRPLNKQELQESFAWRIDGNRICQADAGGRDTNYSLDHVFGPEWTTRNIYEATTTPLVHKVVSGFNSTVFAYGQTSSGKTFTMRGSPEDPGLIPLAVHEIFETINAANDREFLLRVSYMEIYNEEVNDLLAPQNVRLTIHENKESGVYVPGLREDIVTGPEQVLALLDEGESNRHIGSTKMNEKSSRSHTVFRMVIESRLIEAEADDAGAILVSTLTLVDLAGSERVAKTGAEGIRMKEGSAINKSLLTLGNVINKLSEGVAGGHIPYRDSKLTRILQPSLGGNAKTAIICAITPAGCHTEESNSTLRFACRAKRVVNNARLNEVLTDAAVLKRQASEIEELKHKLAASGLADVGEQIERFRAQLLHMEQEKDLINMKLQEETVEREKAQKQVEVAKKMMFSRSNASVPDSTGKGGKRGNRRETWCPGGKAGWTAPPAGNEEEEPFGSQEQALGSGAKARKRTLGADLDGGDLPSLREEEGEEEESDGGKEDGPTPQRPRREKGRMSSISTGLTDSGYDVSEAGEGGLVQEVQRAIGILPRQERFPVEALLQQWREMQVRHTLMEQELADISQSAHTREESLRTVESELENVTASRDKLAPQIEQFKWQSRQQEKKTDELQSRHQELLEEKERLESDMATLEASVTSMKQDMEESNQSMSEERVSTKEQLKQLSKELADAKAQIELQGTEKESLEHRQKIYSEELSLAETRLKEKSAEVDGAKKAVEVSDDKAKQVEARCRELYDCNKRLEEHVQDLQSRKRAPLYQKKQEEELKAVVEKAAEAEVRALDAELKGREAKQAAEEAEKRVTELEEAMDKLKREAAEATSIMEEHHALEGKRYDMEKTMLAAEHADTISTLEAMIASGEEALASLQATLDGQVAKIVSMEEETKQVAEQLQAVESAKVEMEACASAASARVSQLEEDAEATQAAHEQQVAELREELATVQAEGAKALEDLREEMRVAAETAAKQLDEANGRAEDMARAALQDSEQATKTVAELKQQVAELQAKVAEAAGALRAKEELREERMKHKQDMMATKQELQKLQLESKSGQKSKDMAAKELDTLKKRLSDLETKYKAAIADKQAAVAEKAGLDKQLKQQTGQKMLIEKNLGRKDMVENKKRESIMVNLNKSKEQLSGVEEKLRSSNVELQKMQMDYMAKKGECTRLEEQVEELEAVLNNTKQESDKLSLELTTSQHNHDCLKKEYTEVEASLQTKAESLESLRTEHDATNAELTTLLQTHTNLVSAHQQDVELLKELKSTKETLCSKLDTMEQQLTTLQGEHQALANEHTKVKSDAARLAESLALAETGRTEAESRIPELEELQRQLALTNEELSDSRFQWEADKTSATVREANLSEEIQKLGGKLSAAEAVAVNAAQSLADSERTVADLKQQLGDTLELYEAVNGQLSKLTAEGQHAFVSSTARASKLEAELARAVQKVEAAEAFAAEVAMLKTQLADSNETAAEVVVLKNQLAARASELEAELQIVVQRAEAAEAFAAEVAMLKDQLAESNETASEVVVLKNQLAARASELEAELARVAQRAEVAETFSAELKMRVAGAEEELRSLNEKVADANVELSNLTAELSAAKERESSVTKAGYASAAEVASLQAQLVQVEQTKLQLAAEKTAAEQALAQAEAAATELHAQLVGASAETATAIAATAALNKTSAEVVALKHQLAVSNEKAAEVDVLTRHLTDSNKIAAEVDELKRQLAASNETAAEMVVVLKNQIAVSNETAAEVDMLESQLAKANQDLLSAQTAAAVTATAASNETAAEVAMLKDQLAASNKTAAEMVDALKKQLAASNEAAAAEVDILKGQLAASKEVAAEVNMLKDQLAASNEAAAAEVEMLQSQLAKANQDLASTEAATAVTATAASKEAAAEVAMLKNQLATSNEAAAAEVEMLQNQLATSNEAAAAEVEMLQSQLAKANQDLASTEAATTTAASNKTAAEVDMLKSQLASSKETAAEVGMLKSQLAKANQDLISAQTATAITATSDETAAEVDMLKSQLAKATQDLDQATQELIEMDFSRNEERAVAAQQQQALQDHVIQLQDQLAEATAKLELVGAANELGENEAQQQLLARLQDKERDVSLLRDYCEELKAELEAAVQPLTSWAVTDVDVLKAALSAATEEKQRLVEEMSELVAVGNRALAEKASAERDLNQRILVLERAGFELQDQLSEAKACYEELAKSGSGTGKALPSPAPATTPAPGWDSPAPAAFLGQDANMSMDGAKPDGPTTDLSAALDRDAFLEGEVNRLRSKLADVLAEKDSLEEQLAASAPADATHPTTAQLLSALEAEHAARCQELEQKVQEAEEKVQEAGQMVQEAEQKVQEAEQKAKLVDVAQVEFDVTLSKISAQLNASTQRHAESMEKAQSDIELLTTELKSAISATQVAESQAGELLDLNTELEVRVQELLVAEARGSNVAADMLQKTEQLQRQVEELEQQVQEAEEKVQEAGQMLQKTEQLQRQLTEAGEAKRGFEESHAALKQAYAELTASHEALESDLKELQMSTAVSANQPANGLAQQQEAAQQFFARLDALEGAHQQAVERLQDELHGARESATRQENEFRTKESMLQQQVDSLMGALEEERAQLSVAVEEVQLSAKHQEAGLNAKMLSLESQIHWLAEQNQQLTAVAASSAAPKTEPNMESASTARCASLEVDLRKSKRAEQKLQALLYRLRKDVADAGDNLGATFDGLKEVRALEYDVDMAGQKLKRSEKQAAQAAAECNQLRAQMAQLSSFAGGGGGVVPLGSSFNTANLLATPAAGLAKTTDQGRFPMLDKENV